MAPSVAGAAVDARTVTAADVMCNRTLRMAVVRGLVAILLTASMATVRLLHLYTPLGINWCCEVKTVTRLTLEVVLLTDGITAGSMAHSPAGTATQSCVVRADVCMRSTSRLRKCSCRLVGVVVVRWRCDGRRRRIVDVIVYSVMDGLQSICGWSIVEDICGIDSSALGSVAF